MKPNADLDIPSFVRLGKKESQPRSVSPEKHYMQGRAALWLMNAATSGAVLDHSFFACLEWAGGSLKPFAATVIRAVKAASSHILAAKDKKGILPSLAEPGDRIHSRLGDLAEDHPAFLPTLVDLAAQACLAAVKGAPRQPKLFANASRQLRQTFGCSAEATVLCEFIYILRNIRQVEGYFEDSLKTENPMNFRMLAQILGMNFSSLRTALHEIELHGIRYMDHSSFHLHDAVEKLWNESAGANLSSFFCRPLKGETLPLDAFRLDKADIAHATALLRSSGNEPVHLLLYGPPGTGKTTFANSLAKTLGVRAWSVASLLEDEESDRRTSLMACVHMASKHPGAFVLVDEAERLLDTEQLFGIKTKDKAWLNDFLETPGRRVIWISNQIGHIDQAVRRRFSFSLFFGALNNAERVALWRQILTKNRVVSRMAPADIEHLAASYPASAAVITNAVRQAKRMGLSKKNFAKTVERVLMAHQTLVQNGNKKAQKSKATETYTLEGVSMEGNTEELLAKCRTMDALMRDGKSLPPGGGTMLFYGPPGTGKTALARHLAKELQRECIVTRASDLLSPYVGVTEQLIAAAFAQAEKAEALLVIDEADSFLYSRDTAQHSWETTRVNEFLTSLEECRGLCVCTTNRRDTMDAAAMRRFSLKILFTYAKPEQLRALYTTLLAPLARGPLPPELEGRLSTCANLAPGDFHAVRSQSWMAEPGSLSHKDLLDALLREQTLKLEKNTRRVGF